MIGTEKNRLTDSALSDLLMKKDEKFIDSAYMIILKRNADNDGRDYFLRLLRCGINKWYILGRLRYSKEGRRINVYVKGLLLKYIKQLVYRIPFFGIFINTIVVFARLPRLEKSVRAIENMMSVISYNRDYNTRYDKMITIKYQKGSLAKSSVSEFLNEINKSEDYFDLLKDYVGIFREITKQLYTDDLKRPSFFSFSRDHDRSALSWFERQLGMVWDMSLVWFLREFYNTEIKINQLVSILEGDIYLLALLYVHLFLAFLGRMPNNTEIKDMVYIYLQKGINGCILHLLESDEYKLRGWKEVKL